MKCEPLNMSFCDRGREKATVSAEANLREQVKPQRGGHNQNRRVARGLPV
jgi:hypothetical protein